MAELREPQEIQNDKGVLYVYFSREPVAHTKSFAHGEVNVDLDAGDNVVGIELLACDADELRALTTIAQEYGLSLNKLTSWVLPTESEPVPGLDAGAVKSSRFTPRLFEGIREFFRQIFGGKIKPRGPFTKV